MRGPLTSVVVRLNPWLLPSLLPSGVGVLGRVGDTVAA